MKTKNQLSNSLPAVGIGEASYSWVNGSIGYNLVFITEYDGANDYVVTVSLYSFTSQDETPFLLDDSTYDLSVTRPEESDVQLASQFGNIPAQASGSLELMISSDKTPMPYAITFSGSFGESSNTCYINTSCIAAMS